MVADSGKNLISMSADGQFRRVVNGKNRVGASRFHALLFVAPEMGGPKSGVCELWVFRQIGDIAMVTQRAFDAERAVPGVAREAYGACFERQFEIGLTCYVPGGFPQVIV